MNEIVVVIPNYNGEEYLNSMKIINGVDYLVMDNCSTDRSVEICKKRGVPVITNDRNVPRVENWIRCIEWFKTSDYTWMKWLFVGDILRDDAGAILVQSIKKYNDAAAVIFDYELIFKNKKIFQSLEKYFSPGYLSQDALYEYAMHYGYIGAPISIMLSKNINYNYLNIKEFVWAADVLLFYETTVNKKVAYDNECIGLFIGQNRKTYTSMRRNALSFVEELEVLHIICSEYGKKTKTKVEIPPERLNNILRYCLEENTKNSNEFLKLLKTCVRTLGKMVWKRR